MLQISCLYRVVHKTHHRHTHPSPMVTYEQDLLDLLLTNFVPVVMALSIVGPMFSSFQLQLMFAYKTYIELAGHSGVVSRACTFPQLPALPRVLGISLHTADHDLHHTHFRWNYSKRFILWDKVFGTYADPVLVGSSSKVTD